jgi:hypothetical protein
MATTNGHAAGRAVPALPQHTFKDSGITIAIRKVGPATQQRIAMKIMQEDPEPKPPMVKTELGEELNPADPAYEYDLRDWQMRTSRLLNDQLMTLAALEAEVEIDDAAREDIRRRQRHLKAVGLSWEPNPELTEEENERVFYILHIACATTDDLAEFGKAITQRSVPTEEAVQRQLATFPGDVSGA